MLKLFVVLILFTSVFSESVRETETWMPMKTTQTAAMLTQRRDMEASGDDANGSDFGFPDRELDADLDDGEGRRFDDEDGDDDDDDDGEDDYDDYESSGGSGDDETTVAPQDATRMKPDANDNKIPELQRPVRPTVNEVDVVRNSNEIPLLRNDVKDGEELPSNVLMAHAADDSILNKTEVLAALIAGGAVGLMFAVLLILFLLYRMKKKDEGSYDLGKKPIYKKAPTTEIYA